MEMADLEGVGDDGALAGGQRRQRQRRLGRFEGRAGGDGRRRRRAQRRRRLLAQIKTR